MCGALTPDSLAQYMDAQRGRLDRCLFEPRTRVQSGRGSGRRSLSLCNTGASLRELARVGATWSRFWRALLRLCRRLHTVYTRLRHRFAPRYNVSNCILELHALVRLSNRLLAGNPRLLRRFGVATRRLVVAALSGAFCSVFFRGICYPAGYSANCHSLVTLEYLWSKGWTNGFRACCLVDGGRLVGGSQPQGVQFPPSTTSPYAIIAWAGIFQLDYPRASAAGTAPSERLVGRRLDGPRSA